MPCTDTLGLYGNKLELYRNNCKQDQCSSLKWNIGHTQTNPVHNFARSLATFVKEKGKGDVNWEQCRMGGISDSQGTDTQQLCAYYVSVFFTFPDRISPRALYRAGKADADTAGGIRSSSLIPAGLTYVRGDKCP